MLLLMGAGMSIRRCWMLPGWQSAWNPLFCLLIFYLTLLFGLTLHMVSYLENKLLLSCVQLMSLFIELRLFGRLAFLLPHSFILWRIMHGEMPTDENLCLRGCIIVFACNFCLRTDESSEQLFLRCTFAREFRHWMGGIFNIVFHVTSF
jgi:predicted lipase